MFVEEKEAKKNLLCYYEMYTWTASLFPGLHHLKFQFPLLRVFHVGNELPDVGNP